MKKIIAIISFSIILVLAGLVSILILTDQIMIRPPVLYSVSPRVNFTYGTVEASPPDTHNAWIPLQAGDTLSENTAIRTGNDSKVDILLAGSIVIHVAENSHFVINRSNIKDRVMELKEGAFYGFFKKEHQDQNIKIITPTAVASVRGTQLGFEITEVIARKDKATGRSMPTNDDSTSTPGAEPGSASGPDSDSESKSEPDLDQNGSENNGAVVPATRVYAVTGIVEVGSEDRPEQNILLSYQKKSIVAKGQAPGNPEQMTDSESEKLRNILNSIHKHQVLLITETLTFEHGSAKIKKQSHEELNDIANMLKGRSEVVRIEGHTDDTGPAHVNQRLSLERARAISEYLQSQGVAEKRLQIRGYGASQPVVSNDSPENRAKNRRVEFVIVE